MCKETFKKTFLWILLFTLVPLGQIKADGGMIPRDFQHGDIYEPSQTALIIYNEGMEELILKVNYEGETNDFVWIVPTPTYPEAAIAAKDLFIELSALTTTAHWRAQDGVTTEGTKNSLSAGVIVHSQENIGIYEVTVLSATGVDGLFDWLNSNGYKLKQEVKDVLDWYIQKEWYFTAMRINPDSETNEENPESIYKYSNYIEPIKISFKTNTIVYPLKISQISTRVPADSGESVKTNEILLYVLANEQVKGPGFITEYAQTVNTAKLEEAEKELYSEDLASLKEIIKTREYFLTKIRRDFAKIEMDDDLYLINGQNPEEAKEFEIETFLKPLAESYGEKQEYAQAKNKVYGSALADRLKGKIVLKVEDDGKAYYINPATKYSHYLGRPADAFTVMRNQGIGITSINLKKIPVGLDNLTGPDGDGDGLPDLFEDAIGTDKNNKDSDGDGHEDKAELENGYAPDGSGKYNIDNNFTKNQSGKIFLQVEGNGEAWYISPDDNKRYFLGRPADAFAVMRNLGLGISNDDFNKL